MNHTDSTDSERRRTYHLMLFSDLFSYLLFAMAVVIAIVMPVSCDKTPQPAAYPEVGDTLPVFSVRMSDGSAVSSADLSDGRSLIVFFHTGCPDCAIEMEALQPFYEQYGGELRLVLISRSESPESIREYWDAHGYTMPYSAQKDRKVYDLFSKSGIPYVLLVQDGVIRGIWNDKDMFSEEEYLRLIQK